MERDNAEWPAALMAKITDALAKAGRALTKREIENRVKTRAADTRLALAVLVDEDTSGDARPTRGAIPCPDRAIYGR